MKKICFFILALCLICGTAFGLTIGQGFSGGLGMGSSAISIPLEKIEIPAGTIDYDGVWTVYESNWGDEYTSLWQ